MIRYKLMLILRDVETSIWRNMGNIKLRFGERIWKNRVRRRNRRKDRKRRKGRSWGETVLKEHQAHLINYIRTWVVTKIDY